MVIGLVLVVIAAAPAPQQVFVRAGGAKGA